MSKKNSVAALQTSEAFNAKQTGENRIAILKLAFLPGQNSAASLSWKRLPVNKHCEGELIWGEADRERLHIFAKDHKREE